MEIEMLGAVAAMVAALTLGITLGSFFEEYGHDKWTGAAIITFLVSFGVLLATWLAR